MKLVRAWTTLQIKAVDPEQRIITGIASSASTDRMGDVVEPDGAEYDLPLPLLWQHDSRSPIGHVIAAKVTKAGIEITAKIAQMDVPGKLKDALDYAWQCISTGLVRGLSIGFQSLEESYDRETGGFHYIRWSWYELSAVTIPANQDATIQTVKALDVGLVARAAANPMACSCAVQCACQLDGADGPCGPGCVTCTAGCKCLAPEKSAASGRTATQAGATAHRVVKTLAKKDTRTMKKTLADQIATWEATRAAKAARMDELLAKSAEAGITLDAAEAEEHDTLDGELVEIDKQLDRLRKAEAREKSTASRVGGATQHEAAQARAGQIQIVEPKLEPGIKFARYAMCMGMSRGSVSDAIALAKAHYPAMPEIVKFIEKTAVGAAAVVTSHWADDLVPYNILDDFIEYLRPGSIVGKFGMPNPGGGGNYPSLRRVPFNVRVSGASAGLTGNWVGEGLPTPVSKMTTFNAALTWAKVQALAILTKEEMRFSNPSAEAKVRDDIGRAVNARLDLDFVDPAKAAVANVSPASITFGVIATTPTGTTAAAFRKDLATLIAAFAAANLDPSDICLIMSSTMALNLSMMVNTLGNNDFPDITMKGGMIRGFPVIVSEHLTAVGSPSTQTIVAVKASDVYLADDGVVTVDASDQASVEMDGAPAQTGIVGTGASMVSLWQSGLVGLQATREITWKMRRATAVGYISPAAYVPQ
ncbi:MAG: phage major capsid protein [Pseudomonadota bacterium]